MIRFTLGFALITAVCGQYMWDPSGQYRLIPAVPENLSTFGLPIEKSAPMTTIPNWFENRRLIDKPVLLAEPWRAIIQSTLNEPIKKDTPNEPSMRTISMPTMGMNFDRDELKCLRMADGCTKEIIDRIAMKSPGSLETLCMEKGMGCPEFKMLKEKMMREMIYWPYTIPIMYKK